MKDLTCSVYSFEDLIQGNFLYVDKTEYLWNLVRPTNGMYFLSRPRRFGKSLTLSTLKAIFQGEKEIFKGLAIYDKPYDWRPYPIIHLSFADYTPINNTVETLERYLMDKVMTLGEQLAIVLPTNMNSSATFGKLIDRLSQKSKVVILVDEYDKPLLDNITNPDVNELLKLLKGFYSVLKDRNEQERFLFVTGVSKFCHVSLFSDLNNLTDLTMDAKYATMLGYTQQEFESNFKEQIKMVEKKQTLSHKDFLAKIKRWYDGFRFEENSDSVYNPVSLASFFEKGGKFNNYWFETGTPSFLLELIMKSKLNYADITETPVSESFFNAFAITRLKPMVLLFQTGYLTIERYQEKMIPFTNQTIREYYLHFPNLEVERSFNEQLLEYCTAIQTESSQEFFSKLIAAVGTGDADGFMRLLQSVFANIPYSIHVKDEHYYQTVCYIICDLLNLLVQAEIFTSSGRIDMMVAAGNWIYVIEFKLNKSAEEAMQQIENKDYALKYRKAGKRIMLLGVNFDSAVGNITNWIKEEDQG